MPKFPLKKQIFLVVSENRTKRKSDKKCFVFFPENESKKTVGVQESCSPQKILKNFA